MKKLNKKDFIYLITLSVLIISYVIFLRVKGFAFGSNVDWLSQHITIPEYFRMVFYETGNLFPLFNMNLGMGQNIFYFFYYGLLSPIILLSYLLPFVSMANYIQIISVLNIIISTFLLYKWINNKYNNKIALISAIIFILSGPIIYHSHRHIMFVNYFPFLIGALISVDNYFLKKQKIPIIINVFLLILTSFYFSVPSIIVVGIYTIYKILDKNKFKLKDFKPLLNIILYVIIGILLTSFILVPLFYALLTGRTDTTNIINLKDLLIPKLNYNLTFYYSYSLGLTFIYLVSIISNIIKKRINDIFLSIILLACMFLPFVSYLLNSLMYIDGKSFIPFLPLALISISNFLVDLFKKNINIKKLLLFLIPIIIIMIYSAVSYDKRDLLITDIIITITFLILILKYKKPNLIYIPIIFSLLFSFYIVNINESYVKIDDLKNENNYIYKDLLNNTNKSTIYRTLINNKVLNKVNKIYDINQYNTSIYASTSNQQYLSFIRNEFQNEVINKDYGTITGSDNLLFNIYSGTKYLISQKQPLKGYNQLKTIDNITLYENNDVLPIGYSSSKIMSLREYNTLEYPYNIDALLNYVIVNKSIKNVYKTNVDKYNLTGEIIDFNNFTYKLENSKYIIKTEELSFINFKLDKPINDKILIIKFTMNKERYGYYCSSDISINGINNSLSCSDWKYHNNNYSFEYVISSNEPIENLIIKFSNAYFEISDLQTYTIDYSKIKNLKNNISEFKIDKNKSINNILYGEIDVKEDGYFKLTIPYQKKGFNIYVDNIKVNYNLIDKAFIGFPIEEGLHTIEIIFNPPYLKEGLLLSIIGILLLLISIFDNKINKYLKKPLNILKKKINNLYKHTHLYIITNRGYLLLFISLFILDIVLRLFYLSDIKFYSWYKLVPNLFSVMWIILILRLTKTFKSKIGKTIYLIFYIFFLILFIVQSIYFTYFVTFFDFSVIKLAEEGVTYLSSVLLNIKYWVIISIIISIYLTYKGLKIINHNQKVKISKLLITIIIFITIHQLMPLLLGNKKTSVEWDDWRNPRSIYQSFNDNNKSFMVSGLYEYTFRDFYVNYIRDNDQLTEEENIILEENFSNVNLNVPNAYTGIFKDKNLILIQFESIDNFLITDKIMPTTYKMMKNSINFTNHFSFTSGGGSTFNSEFMVNTGYSTAYNYHQSAYAFSRNNYDYSLPNLLKKYNYESNAFHMNTGEYYSRYANYKSFGYNNYYGLKNQKVYQNNTNYWLDRELILNKEFNKNLFAADELFMNYIITYSAHMPYTSNKGTCSKLTDDKGLTELECLHIQAKETDYFMELLLEDLENKNKLDDTIIVVFSDHYLYTLEDQTILEKYKTTENNLINHTPFFIWSNNQYKKNIKKVNSQLDILPTILNLMGVEYYPNYYLGRDILSQDFMPIVYFQDGSWYNGSTYIKDGEYLSGKKISHEKINDINSIIKRKMILNDAVMKSNYFEKIKSISK